MRLCIRVTGLRWDPSFGGSVCPPSVPIAKPGQKHPHQIGIFSTVPSAPWAGRSNGDQRFGTSLIRWETMLEASINAEKYGHPVESRAERIVAWLLIYSTFTAAVAGVVTAAVTHSWIKRQRERRRRGTKD